MFSSLTWLWWPSSSRQSHVLTRIVLDQHRQISVSMLLKRLWDINPCTSTKMLVQWCSVFHCRKHPVHWYDDASWSSVNKKMQDFGKTWRFWDQGLLLCNKLEYQTRGHWNSTDWYCCHLHYVAVMLSTSTSTCWACASNFPHSVAMFTPISQHVRNKRGTIWTGSWATIQVHDHHDYLTIINHHKPWLTPMFHHHQPLIIQSLWIMNEL